MSEPAFDSAEDLTSGERVSGIARQRLGTAALIVGLILLAAALALLWRQREVISGAFHTIHETTPTRLTRSLTIAIVTVVANIILSGAVFKLLMSRYGRVDWLEMTALIAAATLINYVPLRPGFFGRVAYHKLYNRIAVGDSLKAVFHAVILSACAVTCVALAAAASSVYSISPWLAAFVAPPIALVVMLFLPAAKRVWCLAGAARYAELLVVAVRYYIVFDLIGAPIDWIGAFAFACISVMAFMIPLLSNGLGVREWAIGLMAPLMTRHHLEWGITADLLIRAIEIAVTIPAGLAGVLMLRRLRSRRAVA
jgi:hypothetical protein